MRIADPRDNKTAYRMCDSDYFIEEVLDIVVELEQLPLLERLPQRSVLPQLSNVLGKRLEILLIGGRADAIHVKNPPRGSRARPRLPLPAQLVPLINQSLHAENDILPDNHGEVP